MVAYASLSIPAVLAGLVVTRIGLEQTYEIFGADVGILAVLVAFEAWRTRPLPAPGGAVSGAAVPG